MVFSDVVLRSVRNGPSTHLAGEASKLATHRRAPFRQLHEDGIRNSSESAWPASRSPTDQLSLDEPPSLSAHECAFVKADSSRAVWDPVSYGPLMIGAIVRLAHLGKV